MLTTVCIAIVYSPGLPIMHLIALLGVLTSLVVDKFLIFRVYAEPPRYDASLADLTATAVFVSVLVRTGVSVYMLGEPGGVGTPSIEDSIEDAVSASEAVGGGATNGTAAAGGTIGSALTTYSDPFGLLERATKITTLPLLTVLILLLILTLLKRTLGKALYAVISQVIYTLTCFSCCKPDLQVDEIDSYSPALSEPYSKLLAKEEQAAAVRERSIENESVQLGYSRYFPSSQLAELRVWPTHGTGPDGRYHEAGQTMLTWEVLREQGLHTYRLADNPRFKHVVQNLAIAQSNKDMDDLMNDFAAASEDHTEDQPMIKAADSAGSTSAQSLAFSVSYGREQNPNAGSEAVLPAGGSAKKMASESAASSQT